MILPMTSTSCDQRSRSRDELGLAGRGQLVVLRLVIGFADAPLRLQPAAFLEAVERGIERAGFDLQQIVGLRADRLADAVAVLRAPLQGPQDQHVEGALEQFEALGIGCFGHICRRSTVDT